MTGWINRSAVETALQWRAAAGATPGPEGQSVPMVLDRDMEPARLTALQLALAWESLRESKHLLQLVVDVIPIRVFWKDRQSNYLGGNQLFARDAGVNSAAGLVGKTDYDLTWREQAERYRAEDQVVMARGEPRFNYEDVHTTPTGQKIILLTTKIPLRDCHNQIIGVLGFYEDITDQKSLGDLSRLREAALNAAANVVVITDRQGVIVWTNPAFTTETGYTAAEALGQNPRVLKSGEYPPSFYRELWQTIHSGQVWHGEFHNRRKDGGLLIEDATITPVRDETGEITHFIAVKQNITRRKLAEVELSRKTAFLEAQVHSAMDGILVVDQGGRKTLQNQRLTNLLKIPQHVADDKDDALQVRWVLSIVKNPEQFGEKVAYLYSHPNEVSRDEIELKDGTTLDRYSAPVVGKDGTYYGRIWTFRDITARRQAEEKLRESHRFLQSTLDALARHIAILDSTGQIIAVNAAWGNFAQAHWGAREACGVGTNYLAVCASATGPDAENAKLAAAGIREVIAGRQSEFQMEYPCHSPTEERWFTMRVTRFINDGVVHVVMAHEDITGRVRAELERKNIEVQLRHAQKLESIGQLAAGIAHEINTPTQYIGDNTKFVRDSFAQLLPALTTLRELLAAVRTNEATPELLQATEAILAAADLDYLSAELPKAIDDSLQGVERVAKIVRAMKDFSHPGTTEKVQVDLNRAIESTLTVARNEWKYVAELVTDFDPELPPVNCLPGEFNQVILNLVVNAAHAIGDSLKGRDGTKGVITASTRGDGDWVEVRIRDTGTGIPESARGKVFDPFFTTKAVGKGTGQGLAIARSVIVDKHGGEISFETELGKGTVFIIRLPLASGQPAKVGANEKSLA